MDTIFSPKKKGRILAALLLFFGLGTILLCNPEDSLSLITWNEDTMSTSKQIDNRERLLYVFISIGIYEDRNAYIKQNVDYLVTSNQNHTKYKVDCIIYGYGSYESQPAWIKEMQQQENPMCDFIKVYRQRYVYFLKAITPLMLEEGRYKYMTIVLDDVIHYPPHGNFNFTLYYDIVFQNQLSFVSPAILGSFWSEDLGPHQVNATSHQVGRYVRMIEFQSTTFRPDAWRCMYELIDTEFPSGWGIDMWFYHYCVDSGRIRNDTIGIIDIMHVHHNPDNIGSSHEGSNTQDQVDNWNELRGIELKETYPGKDLGEIYYHE
jgi:hypothetical protein